MTLMIANNAAHPIAVEELMRLPASNVFDLMTMPQ
jgi:hypothetical protein